MLVLPVIADPLTAKTTIVATFGQNAAVLRDVAATLTWARATGSWVFSDSNVPQNLRPTGCQADTNIALV